MKKSVYCALGCMLLLLLHTGVASQKSLTNHMFRELPDSKMAGEANGLGSSVDVTLMESNDDVIMLNYEIGGFTTDQITIGDSQYCRVLMTQESNIMEKGMPDLPSVSRSLIIPNSAKMEVTVVGSEFHEQEISIAPSKGYISREKDPDDIPYKFSEFYSTNQFYPSEIAKLSSPYILRDFRGITVTVYPFSFNPHSQTLRVYTHLTIEIRNVGTDYRNARSGNSSKSNSFFSDIYQSRFLNYEHHRYSEIDEHGRMVVICHGDFLNAIQPYVDWKRQKGIQTDLYNVAEIGSTAGEIKSFIQAEYDADDGLTFVQFVGDVEQIPTFMISRDFCDGQATSDASYALLAGSDSYPEIFVGRFSAGNIADVETQVERTIHYERDITGGDWLNKGTGVGSAWGEGYGYMGLRDRDLVEVLRQMLLGYTYSEVDQLYELGEPPFGMIPVEVWRFVDALNDGRSVVIMEGHGDCDATFTIPPGALGGDLFLTDDISDLTNSYMLPFISIGAPYLGNFQLDLAFAEGWLRATHSVTGAPVGAIAVHASSVDLDYASPQATQYEMVNLLVTDAMHSIGGLVYNGGCFAIDEYASRGEKTFKSFHVFGDVSLQLRTDVPEAMTVVHDDSIPAGSLSLEVIVVGIEGALCAASRNYELLGSDYTDTSGLAVIEFGEPLSGGGSLDIVATAHNKKAYISQITITGGSAFTCGDVDGSGDVDIDDAVYLIQYIFSGGPPPGPLESGDADCSGDVDIDDVVYLIQYIFSGGNDPCDPDGDEMPDC
jgi:gingipain R